MGALNAKSRGLYSEIEAAVIAKIMQAGPEKFKAADIVGQFAVRGPERSTLFRWVKRIVESGRPGQAWVHQVQAAVDSSANAPEATKEVMAAIEAKLPRRATVDDVAGGIRVIHELREGLKAAHQVEAQARTSNGDGISDPWLLLAASKMIRRWVETALRLEQATDKVNKVERFHAAVLKEVGRESPECAQRILRRLTALAQDWGG